MAGTRRHTGYNPFTVLDQKRFERFVGGAGRSWTRTIQAVLLTILLALILGSYLVPSLVGEERWILYVYLVAVLGWVVARHVHSRSVPTPPLGLRERQEGIPSGELTAMVRNLKRADRGMRYSQERIFHRVRNAFIGRVASIRGLSEDEVKARLEDPQESRRLVGDPTITEFLSALQATRTTQERFFRSPPVFRFPQGESMTSTLRRVLERMEAWP